LNASNISSGTVATGRLATSGTASNTTFLRGDQIWSALPAGGGLTNNVRQAVTSSATTTLDVNSGNVVDLTMAGNITTLAFSNVPASGTPLQLVLVFRNDAVGTDYQVTWPASIYWNAGGSPFAFNSLVGPTLVSGANSVTVIALLTTDGGTKWRGWVEARIPGQLAGNQLYAWGQGTNGRLGLGGSADRSSPVQVGAREAWSVVSAGGASTAGLFNTGQMFFWGTNVWGQAGQGTSGAYSEFASPVQVGALINWADVSAGGESSAAIKTDGTLWTWGFNNHGQLGLGDVVARSSPVQVGALTGWSQVNMLNFSATAIKTDGTFWTWGRNNFGQLGLGNTTSYSSPKQVGALTNWAKLSNTDNGNYMTGAIKTDGTLWTWGRGTNGALGHGNTTNYSSPKQVGALTNWASIALNLSCTGAVKTDGTLWTWGRNNYGQLGLGNTTNYSSPKQLGAATDWSKISIGNYAMLATKTGGTLWSWGNNQYGQLGLNLPSSVGASRRSSPIQIGTETNWADVAKGNYSSFAFKTAAAINPA
jgi:alpha-tubulin suppressor-like RCC1 family protein